MQNIWPGGISTSPMGIWSEEDGECINIVGEVDFMDYYILGVVDFHALT